METKSNQSKVLLKDDQNRLFYVVKNLVPKNVVTTKNKSKTWVYGYSQRYDMVVISKSGQIGDIININGLYIALPLAPEKINKRSEEKKDQYWQRENLPKELSRISSIFQWNELVLI